MFWYPPDPGERWSVGEHTDYGLLTILHQDDLGGLEVAVGSGERRRWVEVAPVPGGLVCNLGDMLEKATGGVYRSTPHRVRNRADRPRLSMPCFVDPGWEVRVEPVPIRGAGAAPAGVVERWDAADPALFSGTYGEYLVAKVAKVFPALGERVL
jgi:isopenicillin N synthase-like dioxygenase